MGALLVALVFGPEGNGLGRDELAPCSHACMLPTAETMRLLNPTPSVHLFHVLGWLGRSQKHCRDPEQG